MVPEEKCEEVEQEVLFQNPQNLIQISWKKQEYLIEISWKKQVCAMVPTTECVNIPSQLCDDVVEELCEDKCTPVWWCKVGS